ncbi:hypothetical protein [Microbacterium sp. G2-8]|uniref:hypothetical protein n=1 Tax=Microbacterium sp. G2-8 TaxID=2842454 RepID=UPI001C8A68B5|nr:hypothetical protein [Microbacterium sp. G2-8]
MTTPDPMAALRDATRKRQRARLWIALVSAPVVLLALALVVKILAMYAFAHQSIEAYVRGDAPQTVAAAQHLQPLNWFEPWKAPYDLGVGYGLDEQLPEARAEFERALPLASGLDVCPVRTNLAITIERMGDAARAADPAGAAALYGEALQITLDTPKECRSEEAREQSPDPQRDPEETLDQLEERLTQKQQGQPEEEQQDEGEEQPSPEEQDEQKGPSEGDLEDIEEKLQNGQRERDERDESQEGGAEPGVDRPW